MSVVLQQDNQETCPLTQTDLEQDLDAHGQQTIHDPERENQRHGVDIQTQKPSFHLACKSASQGAGYHQLSKRRTHGNEATEI